MLHYWLDKWEILRVCQVPPRFQISLNDRANNILGIAILLHIASCIWMFTTPSIFPQRILVFESVRRVKYFYCETLHLIERILNRHVGTFLLCFIVTLAIFFVVEPIALEVAKACCFKKPRRGQTSGNSTMRAYSIEMLQMSDKLDQFSYDMIRSKKFRRALLLLNQEDIDEADDASEANQD